MSSGAALGSRDNLHRSNPNLFHEGGDSKRKPAAAVNVAEKKRASLDARHRYLLEKFSTYIDEKAATLENSLLIGNKIDVINDFFAEGGSKKVLFFWQAPSKKGAAGAQKSNVLVVSNGSREAISGQGCFFIRPSTKAVTAQNIFTEVSFGLINANILPSLTVMVKHVVMPALKAQDNWGALSRQKSESVRAFLEVLEKFVEDLDVAMVNLHDSVQLHPCTIDLDAYKKPSDYPNAVHAPEVIDALEGLVTEWCKQIEQVLAESEQMRKEADDIGPNAELAHWKARMVKFNSITDQLKSPICKKVIGILNAVKSRTLLRTWKDLDNRVTDAANESKDNVKYLYTLERFCDPLYQSDPVGMVPAIPGLINAIKMIYRQVWQRCFGQERSPISRYYNTSERMTSLFVKITNQMITSCKEYIYKDGGSKLWDQDRQELVKKLTRCVKLNEAYQRFFHETKKKLQETPQEKQFDFSEMYIFGKFDAFCKRIQKVIDMFSVIEKFSLLEKLGIEGMDLTIKRFSNIMMQMQRKPYDILDHRKMEYDSDYVSFKKQISDLEASIQEFIDRSFEHITSTEQSLSLLRKFSQIKDMQLDLESKYHQVFVHYTRRDLEGVRKIYQKYKDSPPIPRNTPPVSGAIAWARQLYRRIETPMKHFKESTSVLESSEAKKHIRNYNKLARALIEFEVLWHKSWFSIVDQAKTGLQATLLVVDPDNNLFVNFDPQIIQLIKETKYMQRLGLEVPDSVRNICLKEMYYKSLYGGLVQALQNKKRILERVSNILRRAMGPHIDELDHTLQPGLTALTWTSLNLDAYLGANNNQLFRMDELVDKLLDITSCRINHGVHKIAELSLCELPSDHEQWTVDIFLEKTESRCASVMQTINNRSNLIESATRDLIMELSKGVPTPINPELKLAYESVYYHFNYQNFEALVQCIKGSLDALRFRLGNYTSAQYNKASSQKPFFKSELVLLIPSVVLQPKLEDIQTALNKAAGMIVEVSKKVTFNWRVFLSGPDDQVTGHVPEDTAQVANNKDVLKVIMTISSTVNSMKKDVESHREQFSKFDFLWKDDKTETIQAFLAKNPTIGDFEMEINKYESIEREITEIPSTTQIGLLLISSEPLKLALISETKEWKQQYGFNLNQKVKRDMEELIEYMENKTIRLSRKISDIDDLRMAVQTLSEIREAEVDIDMKVAPIEEAYLLLNKHSIAVTKEETEMADSLRYSWKKLKQLVIDVQAHLSKIQPIFKADLISAVQKFGSDVKDFTAEYNENGPMVSNIPPKTASERLNVFQRAFDELNRKWETYTGGEELFNLPVTPFPTLAKIKKELKLLQNLYSLYNDVLEKRAQYNETLWSDLNLDKINTDMNDFQNKIKKLPKAIKDWDAFLELKKIVDTLTATVPLLEMMTNKGMQKRHWDAIMSITKTEFNLDPDMFYLKNLLDAPLTEKKEDIEDICTGAVKEADIEIKLKLVVAEWEDKTFVLAGFKNRGNLILKPSSTSEIISQMEDSLMTLASLMSNRYNAPFKAEIQTWVHNLSTASEVIENWLAVQNLWIYLEAVFVGGDIAKQMPKEAKRFSNIDKSWCKIMGLANEHPNVIQCCVLDETIANLLPHLTEQLELCQKSLSGYLESKRAIFPRFYFVSDPALLEILGQASDSHTIQAHLKSVFDNIASVQFHEKEYDKILAIESSEGEHVTLSKPMLAVGNVEVWLGTLLKCMQITVNDVIREAASRVNDVPMQKFLDEYPAQIGLLCLQIQWTQMCEDALTNSKTDKKAMANANQRITEILNALIDVTTKDLTKMDRTKYETFITIQVHHRDVFEKLYKAHIKSPEDFEWLKQARFYWHETKDCCIVSITNFDFRYQCEYLGCTDRLVITPLTDRVYITLAQAIGMSLGGSPAGPAGTGKTESVKDLGKNLAKWVVVFNCSDQMDYRGLGRIYKGLAQSGSWGCFDEFNRIELPVLSVAAQQIGCVLSARKERKTTFIFTDGDTVELNPEVGMFITMNPGYAGRVELPENLKVHFRYVAMMVPDRQIIIRVKLAGCGFLNNIILAKKFFVLYGLCEQQLSRQVHYDFGLRNILSVLRTCGAVKRGSPEDSENLIIMRVLRDMNLSKLVDEDEAVFLSLINDLFPGLIAKKSSYPTVEAAIDQQLMDANLISHPPWTLKVIQLYETARVRHGIMVLGPTGTGKTKCINALLKAQTACGDPHKELRMNPKAITDYQMFGKLDVATNDWTDGIFSSLWRKTLKKRGETVWIVLDGPVDAVWIENLNSVLDDNKCLTLANGDRIPMSSACKLTFEVHSLRNASPATVSRCGMIYIGVIALSWDIVLQSWFKSRSASEIAVLEPLFTSSFGLASNFLFLELHPKMYIQKVTYVVNATTLLTGLIPKIDPKVDPNKTVSGEHLERLYIFSLIWAIGALLELDERKKLQSFLLEKCSHLKYPELDPNTQDTFYEYFVDESGKWVHWRERVPEWNYPKDSTPEFSSVIIPTVDNVRVEFLMETVTKQQKAVLLIGEPGTAKTVTVRKFLAKLNPETHLYKNLSFSSATTPMIFQRTVESYLDKRMGSTYGPPAGKKMILFIDDINMPEINEWGDQVTGELLRQLMEYQGFYSLDRPGDWTSIVDLNFLGAMMHPGGGRNDIPSRLKRQFVVVNCTIPSDVSVDKIFGTMLEGHFSESRKFPEDVTEFVKRFPSLTRRLWQMTKVKMLPTPAKFHYIFNLRDLSRIVEGMLIATAEVIVNSKALLNLWEHECSRVIPDRFITGEDIDWFAKTMVNIVQKEFGDDMASAVSTKSYFVDFLREPPEVDDPEVEIDPEACKVYERIPSFEGLKDRLNEFMKQYNENIRGSKMDLVLFEDAMKHIARISRIIRTPRGNGLLVGVGGSGKQSLTKLAAFIAKSQVFQIAISKSYGTSNLMEDLKVMYKVAGAQGRSLTFIFTDNEVKEEIFLGYINNILTSGEITNLFPKDEIIGISSDLRPALKKQRPNVPDTIENLWQFFIDRVKANLHVVLCFSPVGDKFRNRSLKFPGLVSGCTMDWFTRWPNEALRAVAEKFTGEMDIVGSDQIKKEIVYHIAHVHDVVTEACDNYFSQFRRRTHVTPKSYLSFLNSYKSLYKVKREEVGILSDRMNMGLAKLLEASKSVATLQEQLVVKEKELAIASKAADAVLVEVTASTAAAEKVKDAVFKVKTKSEAIANAIKADKTYAESQLEAAKPALEEATNALNSIQPAHIATVRKLAKPPHLIMRIMDGVLLLQKRRIDLTTQDPERPCPKPSWSDALKLMSQSDFLASLMNFAKDEINEETVELLDVLLEMPDFNLEGAKKVSADVAGLASWVRAMSVYYSVNKKVIPLKANLIIQEHKLEIAMTDLNKAQQALDEKQAELDVFNEKYNNAIASKQALQADADSCKRKMNAATALISGLKGEKDRWTIQSREFAERIGKLVGDVILATAFLSYSGPFNQAFRSGLLSDWTKELVRRKIPHTENLNIIGLLVDNTTIGEWNIQGLPTDELSIQNGIIVTRGTRYPLLIDPQNQAKTWIKAREEANKLQVTNLSHKYFRQHVEDSVSQGKPLLIEDVEEAMDPTLDNILEKNLIRAGRSYKVVFGDREIDYTEGFSLFITTKLPNPNYNPEIYAKCSIIDFTVTHKGLEEQLLGRVIMREKQELETERAKLLEDVNTNKKKMKQLEDNLLHRLTSTQGSLVDDESLIEVLAVTKTTAEEVNEKLMIAAETQKKIGIAREEYRPVASRGSIIYFLIAEMSMVNVMYQTSLKQFLQLFDESMEKSQPSPIPSKRIQNIIEYCTFRAFSYVVRGLYEVHKTLFVLLLAIKIDISMNRLMHEEFRCLIKGGAALDINTVVKKPFNWIPDMTWLNLVALSKMPGFSDLLNQVGKNEKAWKSWYERDAPENEMLPSGYQNSLDTFKRLLLVRSWCLDRSIMMAKQYIASSMTTRFAESQILDLDALLEESDNRTPMICLLSQGSDPSADIENLSKKHKIDMKAISMGQGQEVHARKLLSVFMTNGGWALLQNCHLGLPFMEELLGMILETEYIHEKFRLWITVDVSPKFPITFLQMSIKFTNEPPQGIKAGLKRTYAWFTQDMLDMSARPQYKPLLYGLAFLHSVVQERRKFGPLGWNIPYEFNQSDLAASVQFVQNHVDELAPKANISWQTARYMFCEVHYGGRVTDDFDRRLLATYGKVWFGDHMFADSFNFYKGYTIPHLKSVEEYRQSIESLPLIDTPDVFGLHPNADISSQTKESQKMLDTIMSIQPKDSNTGSGETREDAVKRMANDLLSKLPEDFDKNRVKSCIQKQGGPKPLNIFVGQEVDRMQVVISIVRSTLSDLKLAIDGTIIYSAQLQNALDALYDARVPETWVKVSWQSSTLGLWYTELLNRIAQFQTWLYDGRPLVFWLSGFFNPQGFLTAIRQEITRAHQGWALDSVKLANEVMKQMKEDITAPPGEGVYIHGLFIEGAGWDRKNIRLTESQPKVIYQMMPVVHVSATNSTDDGDPRLYRCPVYRRPRRTDLNYIFDIELKTQQNPDYWILRGVALLCATS
ncbi:dynein heavy chain and region D6 of dynein motor-domain-containing protein [Polychytrium aggregatum]|uniref:dynein heavy chain and region D6 of dynein motor-domain-containing protein n=1 Tax=Polychytrium aggregatum TaxID=110093 RepID=UPI0022FEE28E|nr:dynein heavy chain and region D6 of dynein motor-domain-containing protein [Polychytrium aggregatum]KAI9206840.1 dynein heavy chain and region D6 of dynein motor-domain-containing protein [Polychytrium aggregatum]